MQNTIIRPCTIEHLDQYGTIYTAAFSGEPWNDNWSVKDAKTHVGELLENKQHYGLECIVDGEVTGFHLITAREGDLPSFYENFGFKKEERVMLMGL